MLDTTSFEGVVGATRGRLTLTPEDGLPSEVPAEDIALLLIGRGTSITASALHYLAKHDIAMLAADWRGVPFAGFYPWDDHTRVAARHNAQAALSLPRRKNAWMHLVRAKILGQAATLRPIDPFGADRLENLAKGVRSGDPNNGEGVAARMYWARLFPEYAAFVRDQDGADSPNSMLNYGYMVLRGHGIRAVVSAGLSPPLGLFHRGRGNYFNLVDDLIEPFRPAVDHVVAGLLPGATLQDPQVKHILVASTNQQFTEEGYRIPAVLDSLAQQLGRYVEGEVDRLRVPTWTGPKVVPEAIADGQE